MRYDQLRSTVAIGGGTASQQRHSLCQFAIFDLDPPAIDLPLSAPKRETLLGRHRNQLVCTLTQGRVVSDERKQPGADRQAVSQRRNMSQPPSLGDGSVAPC